MHAIADNLRDLVIVVAFIGALFSGALGMTIWKDKGGSPTGGFVVGGLLGVLGVFILLVSKPGESEVDRVARSRERRATSMGLVACPHCGEPIRGEARVCRFCQREVAHAPAP